MADLATLDVRAEQLLPGDVVLNGGPYEVDFVTSYVDGGFRHIHIYPTDGRMAIIKPRNAIVRVRPGRRQIQRHYETMAARAGSDAS